MIEPALFIFYKTKRSSTMHASYHNHTWRCNHAKGTEEEYVLAAIRGGYGVFGFSDHAPHHYVPPFVSRGRMQVSDLGDYLRKSRELADKYGDKITIKTGLEMECYPAFFDRDIEAYRNAGIEYLILGQHAVGNESTADYNDVFKLTDSKEMLVRHTDICISMLETGKFSLIAHPDVMHYVGDNDFYLSQMERLIRAAKRTSTPLEINMYGMSLGRHYPNPLFWSLASEIGADAVIGADAHSPERVYKQSELDEAERFAEKYKINVLDQIRFKPF